MIKQFRFALRDLIVASVLFSAGPSVNAIDRGINYDPAHSAAYLRSQAANNLSGMTRVLQDDFDTIRTLGFKVVKTFNSRYSTINGAASGKIADVACPMGIKLMLGVYEFRNPEDDCSDWCSKATALEVQDAISSANNYPGCVVGIAVGSEDITNWNFTIRNIDMEFRITRDINKIRVGLTQSVPIGTAQQDGALAKLPTYHEASPLIPVLDFVGANIYPYWDPQNYNQTQARTAFETRYSILKSLFVQPIIVTEEGWPSESGPNQNPNASLSAEKAYYAWYQGRASSDTFSSYYFGLFDKLPSYGNQGADLYFGLCKINGAQKILNC